MDGSAVEAGETLGRRSFSRRQARQAERRRPGQELRQLFIPERGGHSLSVDRLTYAESQQDLRRVVALAAMDATRRDGEFRGWGCVMYEHAASDGRTVAASPTEENPYHGDIILPVSVIHDKGAREHHAYDLAGACGWRPAPDAAPDTVH